MSAAVSDELLSALTVLRNVCRGMDLANEARRPSEDAYQGALAAADAAIKAAAPRATPPRLRRKDESLADYRVAMGWDPREKFTAARVEEIYRAHFSTEAGRTTRSEPYRLGFREALFSRLHEMRGLVAKDQPGTAAFDAFWAGVQDGNAVAGEVITSTAAEGDAA